MENELMQLNKQVPDLMKSVSTGLVPQELRSYVGPALDEFKNEMATELGMDDYAYVDKGDLPSRLNGQVGGEMTKKMISFAESVLAWNYKNRVLLDGNEKSNQELPAGHSSFNT